MRDDHGEPPEDLKEKEANSTTLEQCGWCEFAMGSHRYDYCIRGKCRLRRSYEDEIYWDTLCLFRDASQNEVQAFIKYQEYEIREAENGVRRRHGFIVDLEKLKADKPYRPALPSDRRHDHFNVGDEVAVATGEDRKWYFGEVKVGYRHHDGCVSFRLDGIGPQEANDETFPYKDGYIGGGIAVPSVMLKSEYDFFVEHPEGWNVWRNKVEAKKYNGEKITLPELSCKFEEEND